MENICNHIDRSFKKIKIQFGKISFQIAFQKTTKYFSNEPEKIASEVDLE